MRISIKTILISFKSQTVGIRPKLNQMLFPFGASEEIKMKKMIARVFVVLSIGGLLGNLVPAQSEMRFQIKKRTAFVTSFQPPYEELFVDIAENDFIETENLLLPVNSSTTVVNKKGKAIDRNLIRPGMEIEITGNRYANRIEVSKIQVLTDLEKWEASADGYFESLDGDKAWIDGRAVRLAPGTIISGEGKQLYRSFNELPLGFRFEVEGVRRPDGVIYARKAKVKPNVFTSGDRKMFNLAKRGMVMPSKLEGNTGRVAGRTVRFANDIELQTYVTRIGNRLIPRYQKDLPLDYPGRITYRFAVIEDDSFNAFALPDGAIFIHTGLLKQIRTEAQLAAIIGHEIAHVTHEHARDRAEDPKTTWGGLAMILGGAIAGGEVGAQAGAIAANALGNKYGRDSENQADRAGLFYMVQAGYDPREAPKVWREIAKNTKVDPLSNFLHSDHASAQARLKNLNREIAYSYYDTDFTKAKVGSDEYMNVVGVYLGWKPRVVPPVVPTATITPRTTTRKSTGTRKGTRTIIAKAPVAKKAVFLAPQIEVGHRNILQYWLASRAGWRPAVTADAYLGSTRDSRVWIAGELRGMKQHPYYVAGDFNNDGQRDFVVILLKKVGTKEQYAVAIFNGPFPAPPFAAAAYYSEKLGRGDWLFWKTGDEFGNRFIIGPPASDSGFVLRPVGATYKVE